MHTKIVAVVILGFLLQACTTIQSDLEKAKRTDTIEAYKQFLEAYPNTEYSEWVEQRIVQLEQKKGPKKGGEFDQKRRDNEMRMGKLREYKKQIGVLTDQEFLEKDGWSLANSNGRIGIVAIAKNDTSSEFSLGMIKKSATGSAPDEKTAQWVKDGHKYANDAVMKGLKESRNYSYQLPQKDYKILCSLTFSQEKEKTPRTLSGWLCNNDEI